MNLNEKAMLVHLSVSQWTARKVDKKVTHEVEQKYNSTNAGRFNKMLIANDALKEIESIVGAARTFHYRNTLPWLDDGSRILPSANFFDYTKGMRGYEEEFQKATQKFIENYDTYYEEAKKRLNGMFNESDYPAKESLEMKYRFDVGIYPMPSGGDFRVNLSNEMAEEIKQDIEKRVIDGYKGAVKDLWERLYDALKNYADKLRDPEAIFRDSLVENIESLCELIPKLNLGNDPDINDVCVEIMSSVVCHPSILRSSSASRITVIDNADAIAEICKQKI